MTRLRLKPESRLPGSPAQRNRLHVLDSIARAKAPIADSYRVSGASLHFPVDEVLGGADTPSMTKALAVKRVKRVAETEGLYPTKMELANVYCLLFLQGSQSAIFDRMSAYEQELVRACWKAGVNRP